MDKNDFSVFFLIFLLLFSLVVMGMQFDKIDKLEERLYETQEQLSVSNDQLKMIEMRNEAIEYMDGNNEN